MHKNSQLRFLLGFNEFQLFHAPFRMLLLFDRVFGILKQCVFVIL